MRGLQSQRESKRCSHRESPMKMLVRSAVVLACERADKAKRARGESQNGAQQT
jgi:hypothetical protein